MQTLRTLSRRQWILLSTFAIAAVIFITYFPSLDIGLWMDNYWQIDLAGRLFGIDYLVRYFDPRAQTLWYRPMIGLQWKIEYLLFHGEASGYHFVQVVLHLTNCLLLYWLVFRTTNKWQVGFCSALIFATLSLHSMSVYWPAVHDPLAGVFYLLTILLWLGFVESGSHAKFVLAFMAFLGALMSKEVSSTLPFLLFLADRLLINKPIHFIQLIKRYLLFALPLAIYLWFQLIVTTRSEFTQQIGYRIGESTLYVFVKFLAFLAFPWELGESPNYIWLIGAVSLFLFFLFRHDRKLLFLGAAVVLPTLIVTPIPPHLFNPRYLYLPLMASAVAYSLLLEFALDALRRGQWKPIARAAWGAIMIALVIFSSGTAIAERTENFGGFIRQIRMTFRPIYQRYPTFPPDTFLYFIDAPLQTQDISGLMLLRYGTHVTVSGSDRGTFSGFRDHNNTLIWYLDEQNQFQSQTVAKDIRAQITPELPIQFGNSIVLDALEIADDHIKAGETIVVLMRWKAIGYIDKDYTVFVHLINEQGDIVAGTDRQPRNGLSPTTSWRIGGILVDGIAVPVSSQIIPGRKYSLEIGWYNSSTGERSSIVNSAGMPMDDKLVVTPMSIENQ
jgi:hypothetical protein